MNIKFSAENLKIFIWPAIGVLITLILLVAVIIPQIYSILDTNLQIRRQEVLSKDLQNKASVLETINVNQYKNDFNKLSINLPSIPDVPSVISQLQVLATQSNVTIKSLGINTPSSTTSDNFQIRVDLEGELSGINRFITDLKSSSRLLVLNRIEMVGSRSSLVYQASITLTAYFQPVETTLSAIDQRIEPLSKDDQGEIIAISRNVNENQGVSEISATGPKGKSNPFE